MNLTLSDYADLIISHVYGGLKAVANISLSREAVETEFVLASRRIIKELHRASRFEPEEFLQTLPKVALEPLSDLSEVPLPLQPDAGVPKIYSAVIPRLLWLPGIHPVDYAGPFNRFYQYVVKSGNSFVNQRHSRFHASEPALWVKSERIYVINNLPNVKFLQLRALFENPCELLREEDPFPIPSDAGDMLVSRLAEQYLRYYRLQSAQPNTQNDLVSNLQNADEK